MSLWQTILLVLGLNMDTLAVASAISLYHEKITPRVWFRVAFHFALFQAGLLFLGWAGGSIAEKYCKAWDHWAAFALLWLIGLKMIWESFHPEHETTKSDPSRGVSLVFLSTATSLDALAVGGSLGFLNADIFQSVLTAWVLTLMVSSTGLFIGKKVGKMFGKRAELLGGIVLCLIGVKIVLSH
jgi:manganese efflux pump family protein